LCNAARDLRREGSSANAMSLPSPLPNGPPAPGPSDCSFRSADGRVQLRLGRSASWQGGGAKVAVLLFGFSGDRRRAGDAFVLLGAGRPAPLPWEGSAELLAAVCADVRVARAGLDGRPRRDPGVRALAHELRRALLEPTRPPDSYFEHLVRAMFLRAAAAETDRRDERPLRLPGPRLARVLEAIDARLREPLTVEDLARVAGMSRARFAEAFRESGGATPHAYLREKRLEAVRAALDAGEQDLARLAARFGFSSHAHMTTAFRQAFGLTPGAYRRGRDACATATDGWGRSGPAIPKVGCENTTRAPARVHSHPEAEAGRGAALGAGVGP
jgi:AraC-like DNA-binding protein